MREKTKRSNIREQKGEQNELYPPTLGLELLHVQPFRELLADHVLPPGESLQVKRVTFLFTDLLGSTAMYAREGAPRAFGLVREHFEVLFQAAKRHRGITVKTIGDAVMAWFLTSLDALRAAIDVHRHVEAVSHLSRGDDVVLTEAVLENQETRAEALQHGQIEGFETELRGYEQCFQLQRLVF